jgi:hypothetical protein
MNTVTILDEMITVTILNQMITFTILDQKITVTILDQIITVIILDQMFTVTILKKLTHFLLSLQFHSTILYIILNSKTVAVFNCVSSHEKYRAKEVYCHNFLTSALQAAERSATRHHYITMEKREVKYPAISGIEP